MKISKKSGIFLIFFAFLFIFFQFEIPDANAWWNPSWTKRRKITFNNSGQAENLQWFPVLITLNSSRIDYGYTKDYGEDIRFVDSDDTTQLPHEIETWNESGTSLVWVRVPQIDSGSSTDYIWMYYGNSGASDDQSKNAVWNENGLNYFRMVQHLKETSGNPHLDSTSNANDSDAIDVYQQGSATGQIDGADELETVEEPDPSDVGVTIGDSSSLHITGAITIEAWVKPELVDVPTNKHRIVNKNNCYVLQIRDSSRLYGTVFVSGYHHTYESASMADGVYQYVVMTWDGGGDGKVRLYRYAASGAPNSEVVSYGDQYTDSGPLDSTTDPIYLGSYGETVGENFRGLIDEVRVSATARSDKWIAAQYKSMSDTFNTYNAEENYQVLDQEGFRFRDDDYGEDAATWLASQDTNITRDKNLNTRLRVLVNATGDPASTAYQLEFKKSTDSVWNKVAFTAPDATIALVGSATGTKTATTQSPTADLPSGVQSGHLLLAWVVTDNAAALNSLTGWNQIGSTITDDATDSSQALLYRVADGTEGSNWTFTNLFVNNETTLIVITAWSGVDTSDPINTYASFAANDIVGEVSGPSVTPDHDNTMIIQLIGADPTSSSFTATPDTDPVGTEIYDAKDAESTVYAAIQHYLQGTQAALALDYTFSAGDYYGRFQVALNPGAGTDPAILMSASTNITASGENTTAQLTAPSGKTTGDFVAGRIQDDENPADAVDITTDDYTELEWCLKATDTAQLGDVYQFRVTKNGTALDSYSGTPQWTILDYNYRSIGTNSGTLYSTGNATISSGSTTVTFGGGASLPVSTAVGAVGPGDELVIGSETFYILSRDSDTQVTVQAAATANHTSESYTIKRAYNTIQGWEDDRDGNLVSENRIEVGVCYKDGAFNELVDIDGSTTDATHYMWLTVAEGQRHNGKAGTGVVWKNSSDKTGRVIEMKNPYTRIEWIEFDGSTMPPGDYDVVSFDADNITANNIIVHDIAGSNMNAFELWQTGANAHIYNCIAYNVSGDNSAIVVIKDAPGVIIDNCTFYNASVRGIHNIDDNTIVRNTISMNAPPNYDFGGTYHDSSGYNMSSDTTAPGTYPLKSKTAAKQFVSVTSGSENLHLKGGSDAIGKGTILSSSFTTDIDGATRSAPWDIGADEYFVSIYYSVGTSRQSETDLKLGSPTITIASGVAEFTEAQSDNIGVGDEIQYTKDANTKKAYISGRTSSYVYNVTTATGGIPDDVSGATVDYIKRAFGLLSLAEARTRSISYDYLKTSDLVANNYQLNLACYADDVMVDSVQFGSGTWTTGPDTYIRIYTPTSPSEVGTPQRHNGTWGTGFRIHSNVTPNHIFGVGVNYIRIEGIALQAAISRAGIHVNSSWYGSFSANNDVRISNCLIVGQGAGGSTRGVHLCDSAYNLKVTIWNTIVYDHATSWQGFYFEKVKTAYCYNCTAYGNANGFYTTSPAGSVVLMNCLSVGNTSNDYFYDTLKEWDTSSDYNMSGTANTSDYRQAPGSDKATGTITQIENPTTVVVSNIGDAEAEMWFNNNASGVKKSSRITGVDKDNKKIYLKEAIADQFSVGNSFKVKHSAWYRSADKNFVSTSNPHLIPGADAINAGTSTGLSSIFTDDVDGETRSGTWDMGADEYASGSLTLADHASGQVSDKFTTTSSVTDVLFQFKLTSSGTVTVSAIRVNFTTNDGVANDDISDGELWRDDGDGEFKSELDSLLKTDPTPSSGVLEFDSLTEDPGTGGKTYFVRATVENLVVGDTTTLSVGIGNIDEVEIVSESGSISNATHTQDGLVTTLGDGTDPSNHTVAPGSANQYLDQFTFVTSTGTDTVTGLTVTTTNTAAIASVKIVDATDTEVLTTVEPSGDTWIFSGTPTISVTTSPSLFKVLFTAKSHAALNPGTYAVTGKVTAYTCTNSKAGEDTDRATITVDNSPPSNASWGTITPGNQQIELNWTNPGTDFYSVLILRKALGEVLDSPIDGTEYSQGQTIGDSTVRYVGSLETFTDTGLTNGTNYYYKIFSYDPYLNYASGAGTGPYIPSAPDLTQIHYRWRNDDGGESGTETVTVVDYDSASNIGTTITIPLTVSGTNRLIIVGVSTNRNSTSAPVVSSVTWKGTETFDKKDNINADMVEDNPEADDIRIEIWKLVNPSEGTDNVEVKLSEAPTKGGGAGAVSLTGVNQTTPLGTFASDSLDGDGPAEVTVTSASGELVFGVVGTEYGSLSNFSGTPHWNETFGTDTYGAGGTEAGAASVPISWDLSGSGMHWAIGGVSIKPAAGSGATFLKAEDTPIADPGLAKSTTVRLRLAVSNEGDQSSDSIQYRLQYRESTTGNWTDVPESATGGQHWQMSWSEHFDNGDPTSDITDGLSNPPGKTFKEGELKDETNDTSGITLSTTQFTEIEYSIEARSNATNGQTYYFRVTNAGSTTNFSYEVYPQATLEGTLATTIYYSVGTDTSALYSGDAEATSGLLTLASAAANNVGVGDEIRPNGSTSRYYITKRNSSTSFNIQNSGANSGIPGDTNINFSPTTIKIYRAFNKLFDAEVNSSNSDHLKTLNLTTGPYQLHWACYADGVDTTTVEISSWTTGANNYIRIYTPTSTSEVGISQRHNGTWGNGYRLAPSSGSAIIIYDDHVRIEGIAVKPAASGAGVSVSGVAADNDVRISHCLLVGQGAGVSTRGLLANDADLNLTVWNTIAYNHGTYQGFQFTSVNTAYCYNCTAYNNGYSGFQRNGGTVVVKNCISVGNPTYDFVGMDSSSGYNMSTDNSAPGDGSLTGKTAANQFLSTTSGYENLHLKADSEAINKGTSLSGSFTDDIDGETRTGTWDMGADEYYPLLPFEYRRPLTVNYSEIGSTCGETYDLSGFPVPVKLSGDWLKTTGNGGRIYSPNGYDIIFRASDGKTHLPHEIEKYDGEAGTLVAWVKIIDLFADNKDTTIYICYGNPDIITTKTEDPAGVWSNGYARVFHLNGNVKDSTGTRNGYNFGATFTADGKISGAYSFDGNDCIDTDYGPNYGQQAFTVEAWYYENSFSSSKQYVVGSRVATDSGSGVVMYQVEGGSDFFVYEVFNTGGESNDALRSGTFFGAWHYVALTRSSGMSSTVTGYMDNLATVTGGVSGSVDLDGKDYWIGVLGTNNGATPYTYFNGIIDEVRFSTVERDTCWIGTTYNSVSSATFISEGLEEPFFAYRRPLTVNRPGDTVCTTHLEYFPVLIKLEGSWLRYKGNDSTNGHIYNANGYDIIFKGPDDITQLPHEIEEYYAGTSEANGRLIAWVQVPKLFEGNDDTVIYMYYGSSLIDEKTEKPTEVWDSNYVAVYHLKENCASSDCLKDSTSNGNDGTPDDTGVGIPNLYTSYGKVDGAADFEPVYNPDPPYELLNGERITIADHDSLDLTSALTIESWVYPDSLSEEKERFVAKDAPAGHESYTTRAYNGPNLEGYIGYYDGEDPKFKYALKKSILTNTSYQYVVLTWGTEVANGYLTLYYNGNQITEYDRKDEDAEKTDQEIRQHLSPIPVTPDPLNIGTHDALGECFDGRIDEVRISKVARDACWIQTTYKTIENYGTFVTMGTEEDIKQQEGPTGIKLSSFTATGNDSVVNVQWETKTEISNLGFNLYRSTERNGTYTKLNSSLIPGLLSSVSGKKYSFTDADVTRGKLYYYKLEDIDLKGKKTMHGPICVDWDRDGIPDDVDSYIGDSDSDSGDHEGRMVTQVELHQLKAFSTKDGVLVKWQTGYEVNNLGFHVYREENGQLYRLTPELIAGTALLGGSGVFLTGRNYSWLDLYSSSLSPQSSSLKYWIEDVDLDGKKTWHGPVMPEVSSGPLPEAWSSELLGERGKRLQEKYEEFWRIEELKERFRQSLRTAPLEERHASSVTGGAPLRGSRVEGFASNEAHEPNMVQGEVLLKRSAPLASRPEVGQHLAAAQGRRADRLMHQSLVGRAGIKLYVREEGWYRVTQPELVAAGLSARVNPKNLQLFVEGREIPMRVMGGEDRRFDPQDAIEFYGVGLDTLSTDAQVYWLVSGLRPGKRIQTVEGTGSPAAGGSFLYTEERKERYFYFAALLNGEESNLFGPIVRWGGPANQLLTLRHLDPSPPGNAILEVKLQGVTTASHRVKVYLNGAEVGEVAFEGQSQGVFSVEVSQSALEEGDNLVTLVAQGCEMDVSLIEYLRLSYWHSYAADNDTLKLPAVGGNRLTVSGFSNGNIHVMDVTDPEAPYELVGAINPEGLGYGVNFGVSGVGERSLFAFTEERAKRPFRVVYDQPSSWSKFKAGYDLVILSHGDFLGSMKPLEALRQGQRLQVALVNVEDLYDEFNFGVKSPQAVKDFLSFARAKWGRKPQFVLLVGDASIDPRGQLGLGNFDFVPTKLVDTEYMETASDDWFVDFDEDGLPDLAIGRLPVRTPEETITIVSKIVNYEQATEMNQVLLVADLNDTYNFEAASEELEPLLPSSYLPAQKVYRGSYGSDALARADLLSAINQGPLLVNFIGHGSVEIWRGSILTSDDAEDLTNGNQLPFFVNMTCLNGNFHDLYTESLAEALLKAPQGGAVAVWSSSGLTYPQGQAPMNQELIRLLFNGESLRLGEATMRAKAATPDQDVRKTWILFGDPSMKLR